MAGTVAFDVVVALIFIYLQYSLYTTVLMEIVNSLFGLRARNLRYTMRRLLMQEVQQPNYFLNLWWQFRASCSQLSGVAPVNLAHDDLYKAVWRQPGIRHLSGGGLSNTPSYISPELFSKALVDAIQTRDLDLGPLSRIEIGLQNFKETDTIRHLQSLMVDANNDISKFTLLVERWYEEVMERSTGWFKRTTQILLIIISATLVYGFDLDTIQIVKRLSENQVAASKLAASAEILAAKGDVGIEELKTQNTALKESIDNTNGLISKEWDWRREKKSGTFSGCLLTILALSLGAPFWFDLLNKVIKLRSSIPIVPSAGSTSDKKDVKPKVNRAG